MLARGGGVLCTFRMGNYLVLLFLLSKVVYIANAVGQLWMLNSVLGFDFTFYGFKMAKEMVADYNWADASIVAFPRVTLCDFNVRRLGNIHPYTVQCVLPINLFNEKIYIFLWFWMIAIALVSLLSFLTWSMRFAIQPDRLRFIKNHLRSGDRLNTDSDNDLTETFLDDYLRQDGAFLMRLIAHNTNHITTTEIICSSWDFWKDIVIDRRQKKRGVSKEKTDDEKPGKPKNPPPQPPPYSADNDIPMNSLKHPSAPPSPDTCQADTLPMKKPLVFDDTIDTHV